MKKSIFVLALLGLCLGLSSCEDPTKGENGNNGDSDNNPTPVDTTSEVTPPKGAFSVAEKQYVKFAPGNLQYTQSSDTWSFAANQYDMLGEANVTVDGNLADVIDLFGWSGSTGAAKWGISTSADCNDYSGDFMDWGKNVGDGTTWRTLTSDEWNYLFWERNNARDLQGVARIQFSNTEYVNGLILLPDGWTCHEGITFKSGYADEYGIQKYADYQIFTLSQWQVLEKAGATFFPASGDRYGLRVGDVQNSGGYWSATPNVSYDAHTLVFVSSEAYMGYGIYFLGQSVRLVQDVKL